SPKHVLQHHSVHLRPFDAMVSSALYAERDLTRGCVYGIDVDVNLMYAYFTKYNTSAFREDLLWSFCRQDVRCGSERGALSNDGFWCRSPRDLHTSRLVHRRASGLGP